MRGIVGTAGWISVVLALAACQPAAEAEAPPSQTQDAEPPEIMKQTFATCEWGQVQGSGLSIWAYACGPEAGDTRLVADDSLPGFTIEGTYEGETSRRPAIVVFKKAADAPIESILDQVRARSPGPASTSCTLQPRTYPDAMPGSYGFEPTGALADRWNAFASGENDAAPVDPPCGDYGPQMSGDRSFHVLDGDPTTVVMVDYGSEIQIFDVSTLRPAG